MPGPAMHHMIADRLTSRIRSNSGLGPALSTADYANLQGLLADPANLPYLFLGCQGPDFLFFNTQDIHPALGALTEAYFDVYDFIKRFEQTLLDAVPQPVLDALAAYDEAKNELIEDSALLSELQQTFDDLNRLLDGFMSTITTMLKRFVSELNVFNPLILKHPVRDGVAAPDGKWWWFDTLHYRKTGKYAAALLEATRDMSSPLHLYALGYLTHVAADTVGHAYVNIYSGGPYRLHDQRHKTGENYQDVFNLLGETGQDWNYSKLHAFYNFNFDGTISETAPDDYTNLPPDLAQLIVDTINAIYQEDGDAAPEYGAAITTEDINDTYRLWHRWFTGATDTGTLPPPVSYSFSAELREVWEKTMDNLGEAGDFLRDAVDSSSDFGILSIFLILAAAVVAAVMAAAALADGIAGAIATTGTATIRAAACLIYEQVYNAYQNFRLGIALNGLAFPMREHLTEPRFRQFITPSEPDSTGVTAQTIGQFLPRLRFSPAFLSDPLGFVFSLERHLCYPLTAAEKIPVRGAPDSYFTRLPTHYAFGDIPLDNFLLEQLANIAADDPDERVFREILREGTLGNALDLSGALYDRWFQNNLLPDFNLDADRGYGYLCWTQDGDAVNFPTELRSNTDAVDATEVDIRLIP